MALVIAKTREAVGTIVMDHPQKRNARSEALIDKVTAALNGFRQNKIGVAVLRAPAGTRVWSADHNVGELSHRDRDYQEGLNAFREKRRPSFQGE